MFCVSVKLWLYFQKPEVNIDNGSDSYAGPFQAKRREEGIFSIRWRNKDITPLEKNRDLSVETPDRLKSDLFPIFSLPIIFYNAAVDHLYSRWSLEICYGKRCSWFSYWSRHHIKIRLFMVILLLSGYAHHFRIQMQQWVIVYGQILLIKNEIFSLRR